MSEANEVMIVIKDWVKKAENDLKNASYTLGMGEDCPTDTVCFHAQQCVEKYLKDFLVSQGIDFPKTHDIKQLIFLFSKNVRLTLTPEEQRRLTDYATVTRYPGDYEPVSLAEAKRAVKIARKARKEIRTLLPKKTLHK